MADVASFATDERAHGACTEPGSVRVSIKSTTTAAPRSWRNLGILKVRVEIFVVAVVDAEQAEALARERAQQSGDILVECAKALNGYL